MNALGPHASYIVAAFAAAGIIFGWMIASSVLAHRAARVRLETLEAGQMSGARDG